MPKMYDELAAWWPLLSPAADYEEEAAFYARMLARNICGDQVKHRIGQIPAEIIRGGRQLSFLYKTSPLL